MHPAAARAPPCLGRTLELVTRSTAPRSRQSAASQRPRLRDPQRIRREDQRLQRRQRAGDAHARAQLTGRYLPLARQLAARYRKGREPFDDLVQVASLGLVKAVKRWDPDRGTTFSTYAVPTILGELRRYFRDSTWAVRPPRGMQELAQQVAEARDRLGQKLGRDPTVAELAGALGRSHEETIEGLEAGGARYADSLDAPVASEDDTSVTRVEQLGAPDPGYANAEARALLDDLARVLDPRARLVVRLRFREGLLQREIAERLGCSQMQISRILRGSLERLRQHAARPSQTGTGSPGRPVGTRLPTSDAPKETDMLTLTSTAVEAVRGIVAGSPIEGTGGIRIAPVAPTPEGTPMQVTVADKPNATDETVDERGAKVFVAAEAAPFLDDKVLDANVDSGQVHFTIADAGPGSGPASS